MNKLYVFVPLLLLASIGIVQLGQMLITFGVVMIFVTIGAALIAYIKGGSSCTSRPSSSSSVSQS